MKALTRTSPLPVLRREFDRLFDDFFPIVTSDSRMDMMPPVDFSETEDAFVARMDLPGMNRDDIHVDLEDRRLTISGERRQVTEEKDANYHRMERSSGSFCRSLSLPSEVKADEIKASFHEGVLTVHIPKTVASKPRRIEVTTNGH